MLIKYLLSPSPTLQFLPLLEILFDPFIEPFAKQLHKAVAVLVDSRMKRKPGVFDLLAALLTFLQDLTFLIQRVACVQVLFVRDRIDFSPSLNYLPTDFVDLRHRSQLRELLFLQHLSQSLDVLFGSLRLLKQELEGPEPLPQGVLSGLFLVVDPRLE